MKRDVTLMDLFTLAMARSWLKICQCQLRDARIAGDPALILFGEMTFGHALDRLWEAQQRAA